MAVAVLSCGCNRQEAATASAVLVDLDAVARAMGRDRAIDKRVEQATQALNTRLLEAAANMEKELKRQQTEIGTNATDQQRAKVRQTAQKIQENIQNNKEIAAQARQRFQLEEIQRFRSEVKVVAAPIAEKHRASMILLAGNDVLWFKPSADITATVIAEMRSQIGTSGQPSPGTQTNATNSVEGSPTDKDAVTNTNR